MSKNKKQKLEEDSIYWTDRDNLYIHYLYRITNKNNGKYYIGIHSILKSKGKTPENDNYYGSGTEIKEAIKKEGKENFTKEILKIFSTRDEVKKAEKEIVTIDVVKDPKSYNRTVGGGSNNCGKITVVIKNSEKIVTIDSEEYYNNKDLYELRNIPVKLKSNPSRNFLKISKEEYDKNRDLYITSSNGKVSAELLDKDGNRTGKYVKVDKEEYDKYKNIKYILKKEQLVGKVLCKNSNNPNDIIQIPKDDPRYLSGEYIPITKGVHLTEEQKINMFGEKNGMFGTHWITDGYEDKIIKDGEDIPDGWKPGRVSSNGKKKYRDIITGKVFYYLDEELDNLNNDNLKLAFLFDKDNNFISNKRLELAFNDLNIINNKVYSSDISIISNYFNICSRTTKKILEYYKIEVIDKQIIDKEEILLKFKELKTIKKVKEYFSVSKDTISNWIKKLEIREEVKEIIKSTKKHK